MDIRIDKNKGYMEVIFIYRDCFDSVLTLILVFGVIFLLVSVDHQELVGIFLMLLLLLSLGLLWPIIGKKRLFISQNKIEISELFGNFVFRKKFFSTSEIESMHLHYGIVRDCCEGTESVDFEGLVFTVRGGKLWEPFHYLNEAESRHLQEEIKSFLNLTISSNCSCARLKVTNFDSRCRN